jgi:hypothetical protein
MTFSPDVMERLLVACHRHCCICHKAAGTKMEVHHIVLKSQGGEDTEENGIRPAVRWTCPDVKVIGVFGW